MSSLGTTTESAITIVIATISIYLALLFVVRMVGQRSLLAISGTDVACVVALGAVVGRTTLLTAPTLANGIIALFTLFVLQRLSRTGAMRPIRRLLTREPKILVRDGTLHRDMMRRNRVSDDDLRQRLRLAGITHLSDVGLAVLESNGQISITRASPGPEDWITGDLRE